MPDIQPSKLRNTSIPSHFTLTNTVQDSEIESLLQTIASIRNSNEDLYFQLTQLDPPQHSYQLFIPVLPDFSEKRRAKEILLKQVDKLMDQKTYLERKLQSRAFKRELHMNKKEDLLKKEMNYYAVLKSGWVAHAHSRNDCTAQARIENLNTLVGQLKSCVNKMVQKEKVIPRIQDVSAIVSTNAYQQLLRKYQCSQMQNQQLLVCLHQINECKYQNQVKLESQPQQIKTDQHENQIQLKEMEEKLKMQKKAFQRQQIGWKKKIVQLEQKVLSLQRLSQVNSKWKASLNKCSYHSKQQNSQNEQKQQQEFKIYIECSNLPINNYSYSTPITRSLSQIQQFLLRKQTLQTIPTSPRMQFNVFADERTGSAKAQEDEQQRYRKGRILEEVNQEQLLNGGKKFIRRGGPRLKTVAD